VICDKGHNHGKGRSNVVDNVCNSPIAPDLGDCALKGNYLAVNVLESTEPEIAMLQQSPGGESPFLNALHQNARCRHLKERVMRHPETSR
jgi:hypothetical protein